MCCCYNVIDSSVENILIYGTCDKSVTCVVLYSNYYVQLFSFVTTVYPEIFTFGNYASKNYA